MEKWNKEAEKRAEIEVTLLGSATFPNNPVFRCFDYRKC